MRKQISKQQALIDARDNEDTDIFINCMARLHCEHLQQDIDKYIKSTDIAMVDKTEMKQNLADKWSINPLIAGKMADIIVFLADKAEVKTETLVSELELTPTTAKRYLRQLTEMGYLKAHGGNKNRTYSLDDKLKD